MSLELSQGTSPGSASSQIWTSSPPVHAGDALSLAYCCVRAGLMIPTWIPWHGYGHELSKHLNGHKDTGHRQTL